MKLKWLYWLGLIGIATAANAAPIETQWRYSGSIQYTGIGIKRYFLDVEPNAISFVDFRLPAQCAINLTPSFVNGMRGGLVPAALLAVYPHPGQYTDGVYGLDNRFRGELTTIAMDLNSSEFYGPDSNCVIDVYVGVPSPGVTPPPPINPNPIPRPGIDPDPNPISDPIGPGPQPNPGPIADPIPGGDDIPPPPQP